MPDSECGAFVAEVVTRALAGDGWFFVSPGLIRCALDVTSDLYVHAVARSLVIRITSKMCWCFSRGRGRFFLLAAFFSAVALQGVRAQSE